MSYEKVKSVKIIDNKVFINSKSNNDTAPYTEQEFPYFSKILQEKGLTAVEIEILKNFEEGNLQSSLNNKYTRALKILWYVLVEEYKNFNWRNNNFEYGSKEYNDFNNKRESQEFKDLLLKAFNTKMPKERFIVYCKNNNAYIYKVTSRHIFYTSLKEKAKKFEFYENVKRYVENDFYKPSNYEIIKIIVDDTHN